jgi:hypothetical protein
MKSRTVLILWIIAIALGSSIFLLKTSVVGDRKDATKRSPGQTLLVDFPAEEVASIEISGVENSTTLNRKDGKWTVAQRDNFPANTRNINDLLRSLAELKVTQGIEAGLSFAPRFGMDEKSSEPEAHGITATFKDSSGKELAKISFGKNLDTGAPASPYAGGATGRFVRNHADESGFYAVSELYESLSGDPKGWLTDEFIKIDGVKGISITKPGSDENEWAITREVESADFAFTDAFPGVKINTSAVSPLKSLFSYARFDDVIPSADVTALANPDKLQKAVITTFDGFTYTITLQPSKPTEIPEDAVGLQAPPSENYLMTVAVEAELPKEREKPEAEKPEEAEAAQKAFDDRIKVLTERLEKTKALEGRTFEVSKFTLDALLKSRTDLIDKGPGPGADAQPVPPGTSAFTPPVQIPLRPPSQEEVPEE